MANERFWSRTVAIDVLLSFDLVIILFPFLLTPAKPLAIGLPNRVGASNMTTTPYNALLVRCNQPSPTNTLVLLTQRNSGKCDYWCCLFKTKYLKILTFFLKFL
jgi:hypothetical protein